MDRSRSIPAVALCSLLLLSGCDTTPFARPAPPPLRPAAFIPLGLAAGYLNGDVIGGRKSRAAKLRAAKIRPLTPYAVAGYMSRAEQELRSQTAGIGIDVIRVGDGILIRVPAALTFDPEIAASTVGDAPQHEETGGDGLQIGRGSERDQTVDHHHCPHIGHSALYGESDRKGQDRWVVKDVSARSGAALCQYDQADRD